MMARLGISSIIVLLLGGLLSSGCVSRAAMKRMQDQLDYLESSNRRMEKDLIRIDSLVLTSTEDSRRTRADVATTLDDFRTEVQTMNETIADLRRAIDRRPLQPTYQPPSTTAPNASGSTSASPEADPGQMYEDAFFDVRKGNYELAIGQFRDLLNYYGTSKYAPDAHYWIGECYYSLAGSGAADEGRHYYDSALVEFTVVVDQYPQSERIPLALYKLGRCYEELGSPKEARPFYERVIADYPKSPEAKPARNRLDQLK